MKLTVQRPLLSKAVEAIQNLVQSASKTGRYTTIRADKETGLLSISVSADQVAGTCVLDANKIKDNSLLYIAETGRAVVDGGRQVKAIVEDTTMGQVDVSFKASTAKKSVSTTDSEDETEDGEEAEEVLEEDGTLLYEFPDDEKIGLQSIKANFEPVIEKGKEKVQLKGSDFIKYVRFIKEYSGKSSMATKWANTQISLSGTSLSFITTNGLQLAFARFEVEKGIEDFVAIVPTDLLTQLARMANPDSIITLSIKEGTPGYIILSQDVVYGAGAIGQSVFRVATSSEKFAAYNRVIDNISFKSTCHASVQSLKRACKRCSIVERVRSKTKIDIAKKQMIFSKSEDEGYADGIKVQLVDASGDDMEMELSSRHLEIPASQCEKETMEIKFSGPKGISMLILDEHLSVYFPPFKEI